VSIAVKDTGMGIPKAMMDDLFRFNAKTSRPGTLDETGTGLGLPVVKKFVELYGGRIEIASRAAEEDADDHGTTVTVFLKRAPSET
jgi:signal transduction histidine kinase